MKNGSLIIVFILFLGIGLQAQKKNPEKPVNPNAPVLTFDKMEHDYGTLYENADGNAFFTYTNTGKEPLIFARVKSSCGCTTPKWSREPLMPGQTDTLKVIYDTKRLGSFHKSITILSNASKPTLRVMVKGKVVAEPSVAMPTKNVDSEMSPINK